MVRRRHAIAQVVANLITNARAHPPPPVVTRQARAKRDELRRVRVSDVASAIAEEMMRRISRRSGKECAL